MKNTDFLNLMQEIDSDLIEKAEHPKKIRYKKRIWASAIAACLALGVVALPLAKYIGGTAAPGGVVQGTTGGEDALPTVIKLGNKLTAYDMGPHDGPNVLSAEHIVELQLGDLKYVYDNAKENQKKTIELNGKTYTGVYQTSIESPRYNDDTDIYIIEEDGKYMYQFEINRATGMVTSFYNALVYERVLEKNFEEKECYEIAQNYLRTIIDNLDEYELCKSWKVTWGNAYKFTLRKVLDGIQTSERITIGVTSEGEVFSHIISSYESMDNVDVSEIKLETLNRVIAEKIATIYRKNPDITYEYEEIFLTRRRDGSFYIDCDIKIQGAALITGKIATESCYIAITIE